MDERPGSPSKALRSALTTVRPVATAVAAMMRSYMFSAYRLHGGVQVSRPRAAAITIEQFIEGERLGVLHQYVR
jgi:hypothetical protein